MATLGIPAPKIPIEAAGAGSSMPSPDRLQPAATPGAEGSSIDIGKGAEHLSAGSGRSGASRSNNLGSTGVHPK
jgi:hypothetical protein